jgi:hypothetical protein
MFIQSIERHQAAPGLKVTDRTALELANLIKFWFLS